MIRLKNGSKVEKGFTLVEVMVALVVLTIGFLGTIGLLARIIENNRTAGQISEATTLAQDKLEEQKSLGYSGVSAVSGSVVEPSLWATGSTAVGGLYSRKTLVVVTTSYKAITVEVDWTKDNRLHKVDLKTIISQ